MNHFSEPAVNGERILGGPQWQAISWRVPVMVALLAWLYSSILFHLALQWRNDSNFSHGFLVPVFSLFVLWRNRLHLQNIPPKPSSWGVLVVAFSLLILVIGVLGAELFLARSSLLIVIAGFVLTFLGVDHLRAILFPLSCLLLMIPIPAIVSNEITFPLQILSSQIASAMLPWFGVPVLREGNIINLAQMSLEIAEACSGIRSLLSLITLAVIYGYLSTRLKSVRVALVLAAVPIAVLANSFRIVVTGLLVQYWNPRKAEGFFHGFSGWLVFLTSVAMLALVQQILTKLWYRKKMFRADNLRFLVLAVLLASTAVFLSARNKDEIVPPGESSASFPETLGPWRGKDIKIPDEVLATLGAGDLLVRDYENKLTDQMPVNLLLAYFPSQRTGDTIHSPKNCLPGAGWQPVSASRIQVTLPGREPFVANRYVVAKASERGLVLYWYLAHGRTVASEYLAKFYLVEDSIRLNRSDGAMIRAITEIAPNENAADAQKRVLLFLTFAVPEIDKYVPH